MEHRLEAGLRHRLTRLDLDVNLAVADETLGLFGPSGSGKTTVLRAISGLIRPDDGHVTVNGRTLFDRRGGIDLLPERRRTGLVFQDAALFPHMTVRQNVAFGVRRRGQVVAVDDLLDRFGILALAAARPRELSGGERQRVALARAVAADPEVLLLDEPLTGLDAVGRSQVAAEIAGHLRALHLPAILVSHDFSDVAGLASRVAVIEQGRIVQEGPAAELVQAPRSEFVAALAGVNFVRGFARRVRHLTEVDVGSTNARVFSTDDAQGAVGAVVSPWDVSLAPVRPEGSALNWLAGPVQRMSIVGNRVRVTVGSDPAIVAEVTEDSAERLALGQGTPVVATWKATATRLLPASAARRP
ncbi:MAG TPA: ATP-binding cassette domain-containing protein [Actinomycetota bacterium]